MSGCVLFVAGSLGARNTTTALARTMVSCGFSVHFAINNAVKDFPEDLPSTRFDIADGELMTSFGNHLNPMMIVAGLSAPQLFEEAAIRLAALRNIPLVVYGDTWGTTARLPHGVKPSVALAFDPIEHISLERAGIHSVMVGDPMYDRITNVPTLTTEQIAALGNGGRRKRKVILLAGQKGAYTVNGARFVADSLLGQDPDGFRVIIRPHPNMDTSVAEALTTEVRRIAAEMIAHVDVKHATDHIAARSDYVVTTFGSSLRPCAHFGGLPLVVAHPECVAEMERQIGFREHPLVTAGAAISVTTPVPGFAIEHPGNTYTIEPFDGRRAMQAVSMFFH